MKKRVQTCIIMFIFCLAAGFILNSMGAMASGASDRKQKQQTDSGVGEESRRQRTLFVVAGESQEQVESSGTEEKKRGWVTLKNGAKKYFDKNGKYVTGFKKIEGKTYSFSDYGRLQTDKWINHNGNKYRTNKKGVLIKEKKVQIGDNIYYFNKKGALVRDKLVTIKNHVYYFGRNGVMYKGWKKDAGGTSYFLSNGIRAAGLTQIDGKYYYFGSKGLLKTGTFQDGGNTYYMSENGVLEAWKTKNTYYGSDNQKMTTLQAEDFETLQRAKKIVSEITNSSMSLAQKLRKCFDWVKAKPYVTRRKFNNAPGWPALYANDHFVYGGGNCQSDAAAFAYLAKALGYTNVYVCADSTGWGLPHSWTEINGLVYDPLFAEAKSFSQNYGVRYGVYKLRPVVHSKL